MGFRFRKSFKIAPGVRVNLGKKSTGVSIGGKLGGVSVNSRTGTTARVSAPGTGISYTTKVGSNTKSKSTNSNQNTKSNGGCLMSLLKGTGAIILFALLLAVGWIAGLVWLIFFRKKTAPENRTKYTIIISILSVISFLFYIFGVVLAPPAPTSLTLVPTFDTTQLVIDTDYIMHIEYAPEDATINNVSYIVDNPSLASIKTTSGDTVAVILHAKGEGTINVCARQGDVESNTLTFEIIDPNPKPTEAPTVAPTATPEPTATPTAEPTAKPVASVEEKKEMVWIDDTASKYHSKNGCGMSNAYQVTLEEALKKGKEPCGRCY